jgi:hypothetical protein
LRHDAAVEIVVRVFAPDRMTPEVTSCVARADLVVVAAVDDTGHPCAWPLAGPPGMLAALGSRLLRIDLRVRPPLELLWQLSRSAEVGVLAHDTRGRRQARISGRGVIAGSRLAVAVDEASPVGCADVDARDGRGRTGGGPELIGGRRSLDAAQRALVARSEHVFIAGRGATGRMTASHRGGPRGFVTVRGDDLTLPGGDGPSPTLAGLAGDPRAGLLFVDVETGRWLQLLVRASAGGDGRRTLDCTIAGVIEGTGLPRRWTRYCGSRSCASAAAEGVPGWAL